MLVRIKMDYAGALGVYDPNLGTVELKRREDPPFELPDNVAESRISKGICEPVELEERITDPPEDLQTGQPEKPADTPEEEDPEEPIKEAPENMTYRRLVAYAKELGLRTARVKKEDLLQAVLDAEKEGPPEFDAEDPV